MGLHFNFSQYGTLNVPSSKDNVKEGNGVRDIGILYYRVFHEILIIVKFDFLNGCLLVNFQTHISSGKLNCTPSTTSGGL